MTNISLNVRILSIVFVGIILLINLQSSTPKDIPRIQFFKEKSDWFEIAFPRSFSIPTLSTKDETMEWICVKNGYFTKCNSKERVKFFGTSVGWNFLFTSDSAIERGVEYMKSLGINCVRIHAPFIWDRNNRCFDDSLIKKLDFLTYTLKKYKIYYVFYSIITMYINYDKIDGLRRDLFKGKMLLDNNLKNEIKIFWDSLMNHENTYSSIKYLEDTALAFIILTNENSVEKLWYLEGGNKVLKPYWRNYLKEKGLSNIPIPISDKGKDFERFLLFSAEMNSQYYTEMKSFLRNLGVRVPIGFTNNPFSYYTQKMIYDIVDFIGVHNYGYYAYGKYGDVVKNESELILKNNNPRYFPTWMLSMNYLAKPIIVDEWNKGYPNNYRAEATIMVPVLAGMYDYDGIFYFSFFMQSDYVENPLKLQNYFQTSLEQPYSIQVLYFPSISIAFKNSFIYKLTDSLVINVNERDAIYDDTYQYRFNALPGRSGLNYYKKRVIIEFSDYSNRSMYLDSLYLDGIIGNENLYWNYNIGQFSYMSSNFFAFAGRINKNFSFKDYEISSNIENVYFTILPFDNNPIYKSHKILITIAKDAVYLDDRLFKALVPHSSFHYYYPSEDEQMSYKRYPGISKFEPISIEFSIPHIEDGEYHLKAVLPNDRIIGIERVKYYDNKIRFKIDTYKYNTCYFIIEPYL